MSDFRFGDDYGLNVLTPGAVDCWGGVDWDKVESVEIDCEVYAKERTYEPKWTLQGKTQTQEFWRCECGNCGYEFGVEDRQSRPWRVVVGSVDVPNFCPQCGVKQKAVKR